MQSIKNTSVAIMLLFLSYGVYQIIMKPVPQEETAGQTENLVILDPGESDRSGDLSRTDDFYPDDPEPSSDNIPPQLLVPSGPAASHPVSPMADATLQSSWNNLDEIEAGRLTDNQPANALGQPSPPDSFSSSAMADISEQPVASTGNPGSHLDSDLQVVPAAGVPGPTPGQFVQNPAGEAGSNANADKNINSPAPTLAESWPQIRAEVENGNYQQALRTLTGFYRSQSISNQERQQILEWLDVLAAKVIYSSEHHLRSIPYIIQPGDTIASLARQWKVPAQLIYNVNASKIPDPNELTPGVELKLIEGPFDAELDPQGQSMTLFLADMYAGRFEIQSSPGILPGEYVIVDKSAQDRIDRPFCIKLNSGVSIFANPNAPAANDEVVLKPVEAEEIFSILSAASRIRVLR